MNFAKFLQRFEVFATGGGEPIMAAAVALLLFMVAVYLVFKRESIWHTVSGVVIGVLATLYLLVAGEFLCIGGLSVGDILGRALRFLGLA